MTTIKSKLLPLVAGDKLTREEFLERWEAMPNLKRAELIGGIVYMPSPLRREHGNFDKRIAWWLTSYEAATPGCEACSNSTWLMLEDSPQPDCDLRILPEHGGQSKNEGEYALGAPELVVEVCLSSSSYDLHQKKELYQEAGVKEYIAVLAHEEEIRWHLLKGQKYKLASPRSDGLWRSTQFPGLWLHQAALFAGDLPQMQATLQEGIATKEHADFVAKLKRRKSS